jgi:hypothetical protein
MRVVDRKTFLTLPAGTIYCKGVPWAFDGLCIKGDSLENDWIFLDPAWPSAHDSGEAADLLDASLADGSSFACETAYGRDGCFDDSDVMLIFEKGDLLALRSMIDIAIDKS